METPAAPNNASLPDQFWYKNRLQEFVQRSGLALPNYTIANEGTVHAPKFRSTVVVDATSYTSHNTFTQRKEAEQDAAKYALESILRKIEDEGCPLIDQHTTFCKAILNEFAAKVNCEKPSYTINQPKGKLPIFTSTVVFDGKKYNGGAGRSKKEAEQLGARAVLKSILGTELKLLLSPIINSKAKLISALQKGNTENISQMVPCSGNIVQAGDDTQPKLKKPKLEGISDCLTEKVTQVLDQPSCGNQLVLTGSKTASGEKSNNSERSEVGVQRVIQVSSCSVGR